MGFLAGWCIDLSGHPFILKLSPRSLRQTKLEFMQPIYILQPLSRSAATIAEIQVPSSGQIKVGRDGSNDFSVPNDSRMSSSHFEVSAEPGGCRVRDLGSSNGLFLNTKRIANALLVEGDELLAGESRWRIAVRGGEALPYTSETPLDQSRGYAAVSPVTAAPVSTAHPPAIKRSSSNYAAGENNGGKPPILQLTSDRGIIRRLSSTQVLTIGRTALSDWVFDHDGQMSSLHLELFQQSGTWKVKDLDSSNGTFLNESRINESRLRDGDEIRGGQSRFVVGLLADATDEPATPPSPSVAAPSPVVARPIQPPPVGVPPKPQSPNSPSPARNLGIRSPRVRRLSDGREYELLTGKITELGRALDVPISLADDLEVSTQHATLVFDGQCVQLQDTGSSNGTFVGSKRITTSQLADGQRFRVGQTEFLVCLPAAVPPKEIAAPIPSPAPVNALPTRLKTEPYQPLPITEQSQPAQSQPAHSQPAPQGIPHIAVRRVGLSSPDQIVERPFTPAAQLPHSDEEKTIDECSSEKTESQHSDIPIPIAPDEFAEDLPTQTGLISDQQGVVDNQISAAQIEEPSISGIDPIDWEEQGAFASSAAELKGVRCRSGLILHRGRGSDLDPVDIGLRMLQITSGWVLNGGDIENWMEAARQGLSGAPREWLNPAKADDASWMLPFLSGWGSGSAWLVFASVDLDEALDKILSLRPISDDAPPLMPALTPTALATFLAEHEPRAVERFFQPFDAILLEIQAAQGWALFSRQDLQSALNQ